MSTPFSYLNSSNVHVLRSLDGSYLVVSSAGAFTCSKRIALHYMRNVEKPESSVDATRPKKAHHNQAIRLLVDAVRLFTVILAIVALFALFLYLFNFFPH